MMGQEFLHCAATIPAGHRGESFTVLTGEHTGEKAIAVDGKLVYAEDGGVLSSLFPALSDADFTGIRKVGETLVFCEALGGAKHLVICGAGHVALALCRMAKAVGLTVTVIDDRPDFREASLSAGADEVMVDDFTSALAFVPGGPDTYFVIMTRAHSYDIDCMECIAKKPFAYVGMMGSARRVVVVKQKLLESGVPSDVVDALHAPIGLSIGAETPEEIAISVMAEIIQVKNEKSRNDAYPRKILKALKDTSKGRRILCTIVDKNGAAPRSAGSKMVVYEDGSFAGTIGGGLAEARILEKAKSALAGKETVPQLVHLTLTNEEADRDGMVCGGQMSVFLEEME